MTITNATIRQPTGTELDFASPTQFRFLIQKLPEVQFGVQTVNIPGVSVDSLIQGTALSPVSIAGSDLSYEDLTVSFLIDEQYRNYREIYDWLKGLAFPQDHTQFQNLLREGSDVMPLSESRGVQTESGKTKPATPDSAIYSDATLTLLTAKNNPTLELRFRDVFPKSLGSVSLNTQDTDVTYLVADVTFGYKYYEFATF